MWSIFKRLFKKPSRTYTIAQKVMDEVYTDNTYKEYAKRDFRPMKPGESGNCARFAATYVERLKAYGIPANTFTTVLKKVGPHAVALTNDGWVLDIRDKWPKRIEDFLKE